MTPTSPGPYLFHDSIGGEPQRVEVLEQDGALVARFPEHQPEDELVPVADISGAFEPLPK